MKDTEGPRERCRGWTARKNVENRRERIQKDVDEG